MNTFYKAKKRFTTFDHEQNKLVSFEQGENLPNLTTPILNELLKKDMIEAIVEVDKVSVKPYLSEEEISKIRSKTEILNYCAEIGLNDVDRNLRLDEIKALVSEFTNKMNEAENNEI